MIDVASKSNYSKWQLQAIWDSNPKVFPELPHFSPLHQSYTRTDSSSVTLLLLTHTFLIKNNPLPVTIVNAS